VSGFLFAFLAVLLAGTGARDQVMLAALTRAQGPRFTLLVTAVAGALAATAFAGWASQRVGAEMIGPARDALASIALIVAGGEMALLARPRPPAEPTRSLFAAFLVLAAWQVSDAARLMVFAVGVAAAAPVPASLGGAVASCATLVAGWLAPDLVSDRRLGQVRRFLGVGLVLFGIGRLIV